MSTRRKLYKLESRSPDNPADLHRDLCRLLGQIDGICFPVRYAGDSGRYCSEVLSGRDYLNGGISYLVDASDDTSQQAGWKRSQRVRDALSAQGWVVVDANAKVRLTMAGDVLARSLVGQASLNDIQPRVAFELLKKLPADRPAGWLSEVSLFRIESTNSDDYQACSEITLPLIGFGYIEVASSTIGRLFYRSLVDELPPAEDRPAGEYSSELSSTYTDAFIAAIKTRHLRETGSELVIPLSAS
jgi:hypothetical protein